MRERVEWGGHPNEAMVMMARGEGERRGRGLWEKDLEEGGMGWPPQRPW